MERDGTIDAVRKIMEEYAALTGLSPTGSTVRRYLWTDAFAVCNLLELFQQTDDGAWRALARRLVDQVHHTLGRHRADDPRTGWIGGLDDAEGERHPTRGGLRIGKPLNERAPGEPPDERLEWDRDGQYFHYLTKWMHALGRVSRVTGDAAYVRWGVELAQTAHAAFTLPSRGGARRLCWKMSIDLSRPLVPAMGQHDPLDGYVTCRELQATASAAGLAGDHLEAECNDLAAICRGREWTTTDPLGIGGLLADAWRIAQLTEAGDSADTHLLASVADAARAGLELFAGSDQLKMPASHRLAFRELGLAIGIKGIGPLEGWAEMSLPAGSLRRTIGALTAYLSFGAEIERFWQDGDNRESGTWREHREINMVMLATSLAPAGFLTI